MKYLLPLIVALSLFISACAVPAGGDSRILDSGDETQLQKRSYQSRSFDTNDKEKVLRSVISTLQDLGFVIDQADLLLGSVSGTKLDRGEVKITVSVRPRGEKQMIVRANAEYNRRLVEDPKQYQNFFTSLGKSMFLTAHEID